MKTAKCDHNPYDNGCLSCVTEQRDNWAAQVRQLQDALRVAKDYELLDPQQCPLCIYQSTDGKTWRIHAECSMHERMEWMRHWLEHFTPIVGEVAGPDDPPELA